MMAQHYRCRDGSQDGSNETSSRSRSSRVAYADLGGSTSTASSDLQSPSGDNEEGILRRRKCQPHHRSASMNESVSSILKPPKYSLSSSITSESGDSTAATAATIATTVASTAVTVNKPSRFQRRWSLSGPSIGSEGEDLPPVSLHLPFSRPPMENPRSQSQKTRSSCDKEDRWVADGVDFCSSVEVHVFHK